MKFAEIKESPRQLYLEHARLWLVGFNSGDENTVLASLTFTNIRS